MTSYRRWFQSPEVRELFEWKNVLDVLVLHCVAIWLVWRLVCYMRPRSGSVWESVKRRAFAVLRYVPGVQSKIDAELGKVGAEIEEKLTGGAASKLVKNVRLPAEGLSVTKLRETLREYKQLETVDWAAGRVSGTVYHGGKELGDIQVEAYGMFLYSNPLHPDVFPSIRLMESEIISMTLRLFNAPVDTGVGSVTSGGTESILMACKSYRDMAKAERGVTKPEMYNGLNSTLNL